MFGMIWAWGHTVERAKAYQSVCIIMFDGVRELHVLQSHQTKMTLSWTIYFDIWTDMSMSVYSKDSQIKPKCVYANVSLC
jgi:hypothetical protein